jgi:NAD(P)-dependent dehydrogenase (short-subunit alcohol dehydrogenase family)
MEFEGKIALITGGGKGIGNAISHAFSKEGATVIIASRNEHNLQSIVTAILESGGKAFSFRTDISNFDQISKLMSYIKTEFGQLDILVNNTGIAGPTAGIDAMAIDKWQQTLDTNLTGAMLCAKEALQLMIPRSAGAIINIAAGAGVHGFMLRSPYSVSKAGLINLTKTMAMEVGGKNIRVNCISPGPVESERAKKVIAAKSKALKIPIEDIIREKTAKIALGRFVLPKEIANVAVFLASDKSSGITGQNVKVDGGSLYR